MTRRIVNTQGLSPAAVNELELVLEPGKWRVVESFCGNTYKNTPARIVNLAKVDAEAGARVHAFVALDLHDHLRLNEPLMLRVRDGGGVLTPGPRTMHFTVYRERQGVGAALVCHALDYAARRPEFLPLKTPSFKDAYGPWAKFHARIGLDTSSGCVRLPSWGVEAFKSRQGVNSYRHYLLRP